mgnify:CR=1 FL=1
MNDSLPTTCTSSAVLRIFTAVLLLAVLSTSTAWAKPPSDAPARALYYQGLANLAAGKPSAALADFDRVVALLGKPNLRMLPAMAQAAYLAKKYPRAATAAAAFFDLGPSDRLEVTARMRRLRTQISAALKVLEREKKIQAAKDREAKRKADLAERAEKARLAEIARAERLRLIRIGKARKSLDTAAVEFNATYSVLRGQKTFPRHGPIIKRQRLAFSKVAGDCQLGLSLAADMLFRSRKAGNPPYEATLTYTGTVDFRKRIWRVEGRGHAKFIALVFTPCSDPKTCDPKNWPFTTTVQKRGKRPDVHKAPTFWLYAESKLHADRLKQALRTLIKYCPNKR